MSKKPLNSYEDIRSIWYEKLARDGFEDIESDEDHLKRYHKSDFNTPKSKQYHMAHAEYFRLAELFLQEYKFESNLDKTIWNYHTNGLTVREIAEVLRKAKVKRTKKDTVNKVILRLAEIMKTIYL